MKRREFLKQTAFGAGVPIGLGSHGLRWALAVEAFSWTPSSLPRKFRAADTVTVGKTGIQTSRLAMGTGTVGYGHHSNQTALGIKGLSELLLNGYDHGVRFFDAADSYGGHPHMADALQRGARDKVRVLTKTWPRGVATARADLERFRRQLGTDYIDIC